MSNVALLTKLNRGGAPEWWRVEDAPACRSVVYKLIEQGLIESVLLSWKGSKRGIRLISVSSWNAYVQALLEQQKNIPMKPAVDVRFRRGRPKKAVVQSEKPAEVQPS
jgi:hypothetical protein